LASGLFIGGHPGVGILGPTECRSFVRLKEQIAILLIICFLHTSPPSGLAIQEYGLRTGGPPRLSAGDGTANAFVVVKQSAAMTSASSTKAVGDADNLRALDEAAHMLGAMPESSEGFADDGEVLVGLT
jgi:hypothetical protein